MAKSILVDPGAQNSGSEADMTKQDQPRAVGWVVGKVGDWEDHRVSNLDKKLDEYYRLWRGIWAPEDKARQVERSKIIAPALQQAIEASAAEMEESVFHRERWFDLEENVRHQALGIDLDVNRVVPKLLEDFENFRVNDSIREIILNGALYGTGIGKIVTRVHEDRVPMGPESRQVRIEERAINELVSVDPRQFVIDPAATCIEDASGVAHVYEVPLHDVLAKQAKGVYRDGYVGTYDPTSEDKKEAELDMNQKKWDEVEIIEYHGKVPKGMLDELEDKNNTEDSTLEALTGIEPIVPDDAGELVEAIIWIANRSVLLRAKRNPYIKQDRAFVSFQYDTVPGKFWGRGIAEKGYNAQKALDAELRARIDSLALSTYPMMAINATMAPRGQDYGVRPGRNIVVNGAINEAIAPFRFPAPDPQTYRQSAEMERMVTVATGAMDSAAPLGVNPRNETASGMSMMLSAVLKRTKRTLRNLESQFLQPVIKKIAWRYMQFDPARYPVADYKFKVVGALGAQAREFEVAQLTQLVQTQPPDSPGYWMILKGILRNYNIEDKEKLMALIDQYMEKSLNPQPPEPTIEEQIKMRKQQLEEEKHEFQVERAVEDEVRKDVEVEAEAARDRGESIWNMSEAVLNAAKGKTERLKAVATLLTAMANEGASDALLRKAIQLAEENEQDAEGEEAFQALEAQMLRQIEEEVEPGFLMDIEEDYDPTDEVPINDTGRIEEV